MKSKWFKVIWRFWPGLFGLAVTFFVLTLILQPRPRAIELMPIVPGYSQSTRELKLLSPDKHYLATVYGEAGSGHTLSLYDLIHAEELFHTSGVFVRVEFMDSETLLFQTRSSTDQEPIPVKEQLVRWNAKSKTQQVVRDYHLPEEKFFELNLGYSFLHEQTRFQWKHWSLLSPDAGIWIVPCFDERTVWYERIDVASGKSLGRLELPELSKKASPTFVRGMRFTDDSQVLIVRTQKGFEQGYDHRLHRLEARTGKEISSMSIPNDLGMVYFASKDYLVTAVEQPNDKTDHREELFLIRSQDKQVQRLGFDEIQPEKQGRPDYIYKGCVKPEAYIQHFIDPASETLVTSWQYCFSSNDQHMLNRVTSYLPELHYSVRDLKTGRVLHTDCQRFTLTRRDRGNLVAGITLGSGINVSSVLPGPLLLVERSTEQPENLFIEWLEWLKQKLNLSQDKINSTHYFIDCKTGRILQTIRFPISFGTVALSPNHSTLTLSNFYEAHTYIYDYPFHSPWLLICYWSFGLGAAITLLVETRRWWKR